MLTNAVYGSYLKENKIVKSDLYSKNLLQFFNIGPVSFKGTKVSCYEAIYAPGEKHRMGYLESLERLFESIRQELWKGRVLEDLLEVVIQVCAKSPAVILPADGSGRVVTTASLIQLCQRIGKTYRQEDFLAAVAALGELAGDLKRVAEFDKLVLRYVIQVHEKYALVAEEYRRRLEAEIRQKADVIFPPQYKKAYQNSQKYFDTYEKLKDFALHSGQIANRKGSWNALMEEKKDALSLEIYVGKE
jgi:hypothetical protein